MKRVAEKQLTDRDSGDFDSDEDPGRGFKMADETALAGRVMKGLPKRSGARPAPLAAAATAPPSTSIFGSSPSSSSVEDSKPKDASTSNGASTSLFGNLGSKPSLFGGPPSSTSPFGSTAPTNTSPAAPSSTFKAFSSVIGSGSPFGSTSTSQASTTNASTTPSNSTSKPSAESEDGAPLKYYTNLRGLNVSLLNAITNAVEKDPFSDISEMLEQYKNLRLKVQKEFEAENKTTSKPSEKPAATSEPKGFSMPAPPAAFTGFGGKPLATSAPTSGESTGAAPSKPIFAPFAPPSTTAPSVTSDKPSSGFSFTTPPASAPKDDKKDVKPASSPFSFGAPKPTEPATNGGSDAPIPSLPFKFGSSSSSESKPAVSLFGSSNPSASPFGASPATTSGSSLFGGSAPSTASDAKPPTSVFGSSSSSIFGSSSSSSTGAAPGNAFSALTSKPSPFGGSGFSFGAPAAASAPTTHTGASSSGDTPAGGASEENKEASEADGGEDGEGKALMGVNPHDEEGVGEEHEETMHSVRLKAYKLRSVDPKDPKAPPSWAELGVGIFRLKKEKDSEARRVLLRNSTNGKINMNFRIYKGLAPSIAKKALTFIGHSNGEPVTYCVRLANEDQAKQLKEAFDREIAAVQASEK